MAQHNAAWVSADFKAKREEHGLTLGRLARIAHVADRNLRDLENPETFSEVCSGVNKMGTAMRNGWIRRLTKVAVLLGVEPQDWIDATGLKETISDNVLQGLVVQASDKVSSDAPRTWGFLTQQVKRHSGVPIGGSVKVKVASLPSSGYNGPLDQIDSSFIEILIQKLLNCIDYRLEAQFEPCQTYNTFMEHLMTGESYFGVGVFEILSRHIRGVDFIPVPGWRIRLACLTTCDPRLDHKELSWSSVLKLASPHTRRSEYKFIVEEGEASEMFLRGCCGQTRTHSKSVKAVVGIENEIMRLTGDDLDHTMVLVDECKASELARNLKSHLKDCKRAFFDLLSREYLSDGQVPPSYPIAIVTRFGDPYWKEILTKALKKDLFRHTPIQMAELYAAHILQMVENFDEYLVKGANENMPLSKWELPTYIKLKNRVPGFNFPKIFLHKLREEVRNGLEHKIKGSCLYKDLLAENIVPFLAERKGLTI